MIKSFFFFFIALNFNFLKNNISNYELFQTHRDAHVTSHDTSDDKSTTEEHEKCEECNVVFYNKKALNYHYKSVHKR